MAGYGFKNKYGYWQKIKVSNFPLIKGGLKKCEWCGSEKRLSIDHKLPKSIYPNSRGILANYRLLCYSCNEGRHNKKKLAIIPYQ